MTKLEQPDVRWEAEMHFKISVALELADRVGEATEHISIAQTQLKELIKQVLQPQIPLPCSHALLLSSC